MLPANGTVSIIFQQTFTLVAGSFSLWTVTNAIFNLSAADTWAGESFLVGGCPEHGRMFSSITSAYALDATSDPSKFCQPEISPGIANCPRGAKTSPAANWWVKRMLVSGARAGPYACSGSLAGPARQWPAMRERSQGCCPWGLGPAGTQSKPSCCWPPSTSAQRHRPNRQQSHEHRNQCGIRHGAFYGSL